MSLFSKLFKKHSKELKELLSFAYDEKAVFITINLDEAKITLKRYLELVIDELVSEDVLSFANNTLTIPHKNIYHLSEENMHLFGFPAFFDGTLEVELRGIVNQDNSLFIINLFDMHHQPIFPYKIYGSILHLTKSTYFLLPQNFYTIFEEKQKTLQSSEFEKFHFIEFVQNDVSGRVKFNSLAQNDLIESVASIELDIKEDSEHNLVLSPKISDLDTELIEKYRDVIAFKEKSLLIPRTHEKGIVRNLIDEKNLKIAQAIQKKSIVPKERAGLFFKNPMSHFEELDLDDNTKEELEGVIAKGYRIIGIGKPYNGYFGSVKIDTPLSQILKADPSFRFAIDMDEANEFVESNRDVITHIHYLLKEAINNEVDSTVIAERNFFNYELETYLKLVEKYITKLGGGFKEKEKEKQVLMIDPNDNTSLEISHHTYKPLESIIVSDENLYANYHNFKFAPFKHQAIALNWMIDLYNNKYPGCLLADDMGLGKTFEVITFIDYLLRKNPHAKILIVAPTVLIENWNNEFKNALKTQERYKIKIIRGRNTTLEKLSKIITGEKRESEILNDLDVISFLQNHNIYITTYTTLQQYQFAWVTNAINLECIVYDEAQNIKNPKALQTQAAKALSANDKLFNILMTGTPIENELRDLWCLFDIFDPTFFGSWKKFRSEYVSKNSDTAESLLRAKISNYMLRRMKNDVLEGLPKKFEPKFDATHPNHYAPIDCFLREEEAQKYLSIINSNAMSLSKLRDLRLFSMHPVLLEKEKMVNIDEFVEQDILGSFSKTKKLLELLQNIKQKEEKAIIFVISKSMQLLLQYTLRVPLDLEEISVINGDNNKAEVMHAKLENFRAKKGFNVIILSPLAAGVGLTINEANHVIHLERHWNPAKEDQASDRVYRIGQTKDVYIHHIVLKLPENYKKKSFDEGLNQLILNKKTLSNDALIPSSAISEQELLDSLFQTTKKASNPFEKIDTMSFDAFEFFTKEMFNKLGYQSSLTEKIPCEFGADVIAIKGNEILAIQCKHSKVGIRVDAQAIRQLHSEAKPYYKPTKLIAITNSYFNENAINLADVHNVEIIDRSNMMDYFGSLE